MGKGGIFGGGTFFLYYSSIANILIDITAFLYLMGIIVCTRIYRKRGRLSDKVFFAALILDMILAVSDIMLIACCGHTAAGVMFFGSIQMILTAVMGFITVLYLTGFQPSGEELIKKRWKIYAIPAVIMAVLVVINLFTDVLFFIDPLEQDYLFGSVYELIYVTIAVYTIIAFVILWRVSKRGMIALILLLAAGTLLSTVYYDINTMVFDYAVLLSYMLVGSMNRAFHEEES